MFPYRFGAVCAAAVLTFTVSAAAVAEVAQRGDLRVSFGGKLSPHDLPRTGLAPVGVEFVGRIRALDGHPPQLRRISIAVNRNGRLDQRGIPRCNFHQIQPATSAEARRACGSSLLGRGRFAAHVALPDQSPYPSNGEILAFNGNLHGRPVIYAHIYGTEPLPTSVTIPFELKRTGGAYGTRLVADLPRVAADWGFVSFLRLKLRRTFRREGRTQSYLSAGCPAPKGFHGATFNFARVSFGFEDGRALEAVLTRSCRVRE